MTTRIEPPDDRATILANEALEQVRRLGELASFADADATEAQILTISLAIRNYYIERTESTHSATMATLDALRGRS